MIGIRKPFSNSLFKQNDPKSRVLVKKFFADRGIKLVDHPDRYDIDLITEDGKFKVEIEHRKSWKLPKFKFPTVNILERKGEYFKKGETHYCILSNDFKHIGFIPADKIQKFIKPKFLREIPNKFVSKGEYAYQIPVNKFEFYPL